MSQESLITNSNNDIQVPGRDSTVRQPSLFDPPEERSARGSSLSDLLPNSSISDLFDDLDDTKIPDLMAEANELEASSKPESSSKSIDKPLPKLKSLAGLKTVENSDINAALSSSENTAVFRDPRVISSDQKAISGDQKAISLDAKTLSTETQAVSRNGGLKSGNHKVVSRDASLVSSDNKAISGSIKEPGDSPSMSGEISLAFNSIADTHASESSDHEANEVKPVSLDLKMEPVLGNSETTRLIEAMPDSDVELPPPKIGADSSLVVRFGKSEDAELSQNYTVGEQIGRGASGKVYEAWRKRDNKHVVIKVLITENLSDDEESRVAIRRFYREAELITSLHEEHIVECVDYGRYQGKPCMVLEFIDGLSLDQLIIKYGALPLAYATGVIEQLLKALAETHSKGIIHRDIKPSNIMVFDTPPPYEIRVLDFGISTVLDGLQSQTLMTQAGNVRGTPSYMAPELFTGETRASVESDLYAVGLCYYECLTGLVAFNDKSFMRVAYKQVNEQLEVPGYIPQSIADIILKLCEKPIRLRYHSAQEVLDDIHANIDKALAEEESCMAKWQKDKKPAKRHSSSLLTNESKLPFKQIIIGLLILIFVIIGVIIYLNVLISTKTPEDPFSDVATETTPAPAPQPVEIVKTGNPIHDSIQKARSEVTIALRVATTELTKSIEREKAAEAEKDKAEKDKEQQKPKNPNKNGKNKTTSQPGGKKRDDTKTAVIPGLGGRR